MQLVFRQRKGNKSTLFPNNKDDQHTKRKLPGTVLLTWCQYGTKTRDERKAENFQVLLGNDPRFIQSGVSI